MGSWGGDTPPEVIWSLNDLLEYARENGFHNDGSEFEEDQSIDSNVIQNSILIDELTEFFETRLK